MQVSFQAVSGLGTTPRPEPQRHGQGFEAFMELALADDSITPSSPSGPGGDIPAKDQPLLQGAGQGVDAEFQMNDDDLTGKTSGVAAGDAGMSAGSGQTNSPPKVGDTPGGGLTNGGNKIANTDVDNQLPKISDPEVGNQLPKVAGPAAPPATIDRGIGVDGSGLSNKDPDGPQTSGAVRLSKIFDTQIPSAATLSVLLALQERDS